MILRKSKFHLKIFLTSNIAQSTISVDAGAVLREKGLFKAVQNVSKSICYNVLGLGHCMLF